MYGVHYADARSGADVQQGWLPAGGGNTGMNQKVATQA
jgi:hypothetical protein